MLPLFSSFHSFLFKYPNRFKTTPTQRNPPDTNVKVDTVLLKDDIIFINDPSLSPSASVASAGAHGPAVWGAVDGGQGGGGGVGGEGVGLGHCQEVIQELGITGLQLTVLKLSLSHWSRHWINNNITNNNRGHSRCWDHLIDWAQWAHWSPAAPCRGPRRLSSSCSWGAPGWWWRCSRRSAWTAWWSWWWWSLAAASASSTFTTFQIRSEIFDIYRKHTCY